MPKLFSIRPAMKIRGRQFKGLRGYAGKPFHPPLTDIPVTCYVLVAVFDLISFYVDATDGSASIARDFYVSGTHVIIAGLIVSVPTALTGFWDWLKSTTKGTQARRTANWHMTVMLTVTGIVILDVILRLAYWDEAYAELPVLVLSLLAGGLVAFGAAYGGTLVYDYGFNVETSGDHPVWHESETDVMPGQETHP
jgi:uncharacterized membrane protein